MLLLIQRQTRFLSFIFTILCIKSVLTQAVNPTILQDSRDLPKTDGTFGFLYRTEDGIAHAAKGDSNGVISGRFSYTDPTGLKVNYNYNAGARFTPGYNYNDQEPVRPAKYSSQYRQEDAGFNNAPQQQDYAPEPPRQYRTRPAPPPRYNTEPVDVYQQRRTRPIATENHIYNDNQQRPYSSRY